MSIAQQISVRMFAFATIQDKENTVAKYLDKLHSIENKLKITSLSSTQRKALEETVNTLKDQLATLEKELKRLRKENRRSFIVSIFLFVMVVLIYYMIQWPW